MHACRSLMLLLLLSPPVLAAEGAVELSGWAGAGGALGQSGGPRYLSGLGLELEPLESLLVGLRIDGGISMLNWENPEKTEPLGELSIAPIMGLRVQGGITRLDLLVSVGWTRLLGREIRAISDQADLLRVRPEIRLTFVTFSFYGHPFHLGATLGIDAYLLGDGGPAYGPLIGGLTFGADAREP